LILRFGRIAQIARTDIFRQISGTTRRKVAAFTFHPASMRRSEKPVNERRGCYRQLKIWIKARPPSV
jgi:hypothetical protein